MAKKRNKETRTSNGMLPVMRPDAAGIDIGATEIYVAVPADRSNENVRSFATFTQDLYALADWLKQHSIKTVAMESTGVYWIPLFQILEERGFEVCLVNARHVKNVAAPTYLIASGCSFYIRSDCCERRTAQSKRCAQ